VVERHLAKVDVEGSNPFSRSKLAPRVRPERCAAAHAMRAQTRWASPVGDSVQATVIATVPSSVSANSPSPCGIGTVEIFHASGGS
jgi:hypothetical protein